MRAKFEQITAPIADVLIAADQRANVTFEGSFESTLFHEIAHGLGLTRTVDGTRTVREALRALGSAVEEEKADVLGMFMVDRLEAWGATDTEPMADRYVSYLAELLRHVRLGGASAYTLASASEIAFLREHDAVVRDADGRYRVILERMPAALEALAGRLLMLQGDGDVEAVRAFYDATPIEDPLRTDLARLDAAGIPINVSFENPTLLG